MIEKLEDQKNKYAERISELEEENNKMRHIVLHMNPDVDNLHQSKSRRIDDFRLHHNAHPHLDDRVMGYSHKGEGKWEGPDHRHGDESHYYSYQGEGSGRDHHGRGSD